MRVSLQAQALADLMVIDEQPGEELSSARHLERMSPSAPPVRRHDEPNREDHDMSTTQPAQDSRQLAGRSR
jgi:hypothetical protein